MLAISISRRMAAVAISVCLLTVAFAYFGAKDLLKNLTSLPVWSIAAIVGLLTVNLFVVSFRLWRILHHFGLPLPLGVALRASLAGHAASLFFISLFGQVVGRRAILQNYGIPPASVAAITAYERAVLTVVGAALCCAGAVLLLGWPAVIQVVNSASLLEAAIVAGCALTLSFLIGRSRFEARIAARALKPSAALRALEVAAISLAGQLLLLSAYAVAALVFRPDLNLVSVLAAAAVVSFAASMPISVNGWGAREIASIGMFGKLGIAAAKALAASIAIGLSSMIVTLAAAPLAFTSLLHRGRRPVTVGLLTGNSTLDELEKISAWTLATAAAVLVFFQVHVDLYGTLVTVNLADPFAVLALAAVAAHSIQAGRLPVWRVQHTNAALIGVTLLLVAGFLHGMPVVGVTTWALTARTLGWVVLLGYLCAGYLVTRHAGLHGRRRLLETMTATAVVIVVIQIALRWDGTMDIFTGLPLPAGFEGYAANRNAFAFQLTVCFAGLLAYTSAFGRKRRWTMSALLSVLLAGLLFGASRAGLITVAVLIVFAWIRRLADRRVVIQSLLMAVVIWQLPAAVELGASWVNWLFDANFALSNPAAIQGGFSPETSNIDRWRSIYGGLVMWWHHPLIGAGLGVFIASNVDSFGKPLVIHNTAVWILAEFGLLGVAVFGWAFYQLGRYALQDGARAPERRVVALLLVAFALFAMAHEILFQRIFWLTLGAAIAALPGQDRRASFVPKPAASPTRKLLFFVTEDWYFCSHRLALAVAAKAAGYDVTVLTRVRRHGHVIAEAGLRLVPFENSRRGVNPCFELATIVRLIAVYRRLAPDIVHNVAMKPVIYGSLAARLAGVPCVVNAVVGLGWLFSSKSLLARALRPVVERIIPVLLNRGLVIVQNAQNGAALQKLGVHGGRLRLIRGSGVDTSVFRPFEEAEGKPIVLLPARLLWAKGVREFVEAAACVEASGIEARFVLVGEPDVGSRSSVPRRQLDAWERERRVEWWGYRTDMARVLRQAHIVCLPSYYGEGIPMALLEAASAGLPIVTTDVDGCREVVKDGQNGYLVPARNSTALAKALIPLLRDAPLRRRMGCHGRELALREFDVRSVVHATLALYDELCDRRKVSRPQTAV